MKKLIAAIITSFVIIPSAIAGLNPTKTGLNWAHAQNVTLKKTHAPFFIANVQCGNSILVTKTARLPGIGCIVWLQGRANNRFQCIEVALNPFSGKYIGYKNINCPATAPIA